VLERIVRLCSRCSQIVCHSRSRPWCLAGARRHSRDTWYAGINRDGGKDERALQRRSGDLRCPESYTFSREAGSEALTWGTPMYGLLPLALAASPPVEPALRFEATCAACVASRPPLQASSPRAEPTAPTVRMFIVVHRWHSGVVLPRAALPRSNSARSGGLPGRGWSHTTPPPAREIQLRESRWRLARLSKPDLSEKLLEFRNAYAVVRAAWLQASAGKFAKS
jgi:hypothetical protein